MANLGACYEHGKGGPRDVVLALALFTFAHELDRAEPTQRRDRLAAKLSPAQRAQGDQLVSQMSQGLDAFLLPDGHVEGRTPAVGAMAQPQ
jgi:TPR repeat protein